MNRMKKTIGALIAVIAVFGAAITPAKAADPVKSDNVKHLANFNYDGGGNLADFNLLAERHPGVPMVVLLGGNASQNACQYRGVPLHRPAALQQPLPFTRRSVQLPQRQAARSTHASGPGGSQPSGASSKPSNSKAGLTMQPTSVHDPSGRAACQAPAGTTICEARACAGASGTVTAMTSSALCILRSLPRSHVGAAVTA